MTSTVHAKRVAHSLFRCICTRRVYGPAGFWQHSLSRSSWFSPIDFRPSPAAGAPRWSSVGSATATQTSRAPRAAWRFRPSASRQSSASQWVPVPSRRSCWWPSPAGVRRRRRATGRCSCDAAQGQPRGRELVSLTVWVHVEGRLSLWSVSHFPAANKVK